MRGHLAVRIASGEGMWLIGQKSKSGEGGMVPGVYQDSTTNGVGGSS